MTSYSKLILHLSCPVLKLVFFHKVFFLLVVNCITRTQFGYQEASLSLLQGWSIFLGLSVDRELGYEYIEFKFTLQCFYVTSSMLCLYIYLYRILKILVFKDTEDDGIGIYYSDSFAFFHNTYTTASE